MLENNKDPTSKEEEKYPTKSIVTPKNEVEKKLSYQDLKDEILSEIDGELQKNMPNVFEHKPMDLKMITSGRQNPQ